MITAPRQRRFFMRVIPILRRLEADIKSETDAPERTGSGGRETGM